MSRLLMSLPYQINEPFFALLTPRRCYVQIGERFSARLAVNDQLLHERLKRRKRTRKLPFIVPEPS
jgi:hypothetical protein